MRANDTERVFQLLLQAVKPSSVPRGPSSRSEITDRKNVAVQRLADVVSSISGPFSFVFFDGYHSKLFFSRDCLGRRSLLQGLDDAGSLKICSICDGSSSAGFEEVTTDGLHMINIDEVLERDALRSCATENTLNNVYNISTLSWDSEDVSTPSVARLVRSSTFNPSFKNVAR